MLQSYAIILGEKRLLADYTVKCQWFPDTQHYTMTQYHTL